MNLVTEKDQAYGSFPLSEQRIYWKNESRPRVFFVLEPYGQICESKIGAPCVAN